MTKYKTIIKKITFDELCSNCEKRKAVLANDLLCNKCHKVSMQLKEQAEKANRIKYLENKAREHYLIGVNQEAIINSLNKEEIEEYYNLMHELFGSEKQ